MIKASAKPVLKRSHPCIEKIKLAHKLDYIYLPLKCVKNYIATESFVF